MDPISIAILVIAGLAYAINYIAQEIELKDKVINLLKIYSKEITTIRRQKMDAYVDEPCDTRMQQACADLLRHEFPQGIVKKFATMKSLEERRAFMADLIHRVANVMGVDVNEVTFSEGQEGSYGYYRYRDQATGNISKQVWMNNVYLASEPEQVVRTMLHELRHGVQCQALFEADKWGFSARRKAEWLSNETSYVNCTEAYKLQEQELDADVFAERVLNKVNHKQAES